MVQYAKESGFVFATQVVCLFLGFLSSVVVARVLGPEGKGIVSLIALVPGFLALIGSLGLASANVYFTGSRRYDTKEILSNSTILALGVGVFLILAFLPVRGWVLRMLLKDVPPLYLDLSLFSVPCLLSISYFSSILRGRFRFRAFNWVNLTDVGGRLFFILVLVLALKVGVLGGVLATVASLASTAVLALFLVLPEGGLRFHINLRLFKESLLYGAKGHLGNVLQFFNYRLDMFLVSYFLGIEELGLYALAVSLAELLWQIPTAASVVLFPAVSASASGEASRLTSKVARNVLFLTATLAVAWGLLGVRLIPIIFGPRFVRSALPFEILLLGTVSLSFPRVVTGYLSGRGKPQYITYLSLISLALTLILDFLLIPRLGIVGAALATTVAYTVSSIQSVYWLKEESRGGLAELLVVKLDDFRSYKNLLHPLRLPGNQVGPGPTESFFDDPGRQL